MSDIRDNLQRMLGAAYTIQRELGGGGMSRVFLARDESLGRDVVLKLLLPELASTLSAERFTREIKMVASLQEPHIVPVLAAGQTADGLPWFTMPYVSGESLRARLTRGPVTAVDALGILRNVAQALAYAHARGVVHRDIKPENVLLSSGTAVVADFGIAKAVSASRTLSGESGITQAGMAVGTPAYMAPEQATGDPNTDHRADVYAWGVLAYELLGGAHPFAERKTPSAMTAAHIAEAPRVLEAPNVSTGVRTLVMRALEKDPEHRPATMDEVLATLASESTPSAVTAGATSAAAARAEKSSSTHATRAPLIALMLGVLVIGSAAAMLLRGKANGSSASAASAAVATNRAIAVLPLANLSGDKADDYFGIGMADEITRALTLTGVKVIGRTSAGALQAKGLDERAIAKELGVGSLLTGSVQRAAGQLRINVSLLSAADGAVRWTEKYDRPIANVFAVQDEIAKAVATKLLGTLGDGATRTVRVETADPEAYALFLQAQVLFNRRAGPAMMQAANLFERAAARDTTFARAYAMLAMVQTSLPFYSDLPADSAQQLVERSARRALALDPNSAEAYTALAHGAYTVSRSREADSLYRRSLALDSTVATTWGWYGQLAARLGDYAAYRARVMRARVLEPASLIARIWESDVLQAERRFAEADSQIQQIIALDSTFANGWVYRARILGLRGRFDEAIAVLERHRVDDELLAYLYARAGNVSKARGILAVAPRRADGKPRHLGMRAAVLEALGDHRAALEMLERAAATHDQSLVQDTRIGWFDPFRKDPRGAAILAKIEAR